MDSYRTEVAVLRADLCAYAEAVCVLALASRSTAAVALETRAAVQAASDAELRRWADCYRGRLNLAARLVPCVGVA